MKITEITGQSVMMRASPGDDEIKDVGNRLACSVITGQERNIRLKTTPISYTILL